MEEEKLFQIIREGFAITNVEDFNSIPQIRPDETFYHIDGTKSIVGSGDIQLDWNRTHGFFSQYRLIQAGKLNTNSRSLVAEIQSYRASKKHGIIARSFWFNVDLTGIPFSHEKIGTVELEPTRAILKHHRKEKLFGGFSDKIEFIFPQPIPPVKNWYYSFSSCTMRFLKSFDAKPAFDSMKQRIDNGPLLPINELLAYWESR